MRGYMWLECCFLAVGCCVNTVCSQLPSVCHVNEVNIMVPVNTVGTYRVNSGAQCLLFFCQNVGFGPTFSRHLVTCNIDYSSDSCHTYTNMLDQEGSKCCQACDVCDFFSCAVENSECVVVEGRTTCVCSGGFSGNGSVHCTSVCNPPCPSGGVCVAPNTCNVCTAETELGGNCDAKYIVDRCSELGDYCIGTTKQCINFVNGQNACNCVSNGTVYSDGRHYPDVGKCRNCTCTNGDFTCRHISCNCHEHDYRSVGCCPDLECKQNIIYPQGNCHTVYGDEIKPEDSLSVDCETYVCLKNLTVLTLDHNVVGCPDINCTKDQVLTMGDCCLFCAAPLTHSETGTVWQISIGVIFTGGMMLLVIAVFLYYRKRIKELKEEFDVSSSVKSTSVVSSESEIFGQIKREGVQKGSEDSWSYRLPMDSSSSGSGCDFYDNKIID